MYRAGHPTARSSRSSATRSSEAPRGLASVGLHPGGFQSCSRNRCRAVAVAARRTLHRAVRWLQLSRSHAVGGDFSWSRGKRRWSQASRLRRAVLPLGNAVRRPASTFQLHRHGCVWPAITASRAQFRSRVGGLATTWPNSDPPTFSRQPLKRGYEGIDTQGGRGRPDRVLRFPLSENAVRRPASTFQLHGYGLAEGAALIAGACTRWAAALMVVNFTVALLGVHLGDPYVAWFPAWMMWCGSLALLCSGAGAYSADARRTTPSR